MRAIVTAITLQVLYVLLKSIVILHNSYLVVHPYNPFSWISTHPPYQVIQGALGGKLPRCLPVKPQAGFRRALSGFIYNIAMHI